MRTLKITLAYDGTRLVGWQRQSKGTSVQALLEAALAPLEGERPVRCTAAGRTDAGVHAVGQVASCRVRTPLGIADLRRALNARLPPEVRVVEVADAPEGFHARYWARRKTYCYHVLNAVVPDPLARAFVWHVPHALDETAIERALVSLRGRHDFKAFQAAGSRVATTVRTLSVAAIEKHPWPGILATAGVTTADARPRSSLLVLRFAGDGFLRHMVRNLVGTLVEVGAGRRDPDELRQLLSGRDRRRAGMTAPAQGLILVGVEYGDGPAARPADE